MRNSTFSFENGILTVDGPMTTCRFRWSPEPLAENERLNLRLARKMTDNIDERPYPQP